MSKKPEKKKKIVSRTQLYPCPYHAQCDIYHCLYRAAWFVGRPDGPISTTFKLCDGCAKDLANMVPKELKDDKLLREKVAAELNESFDKSLEPYEKQIKELKDQIIAFRGSGAEDPIDPSVILNALHNEGLLTEKQLTEANKLFEPEPDPEEDKKPNDDTPPDNPDVIYRCLDCNYEAKDESELTEHQKTHQANDKSKEPPQNTKEPKKMSAQERLKQRTGQA